MYQKIKWELSNIRRHWKLFSFIGILLYILYRIFISNYMIVNPIVKKDNYEDPIQLHNEVATCNQSLTDAQDAIHAQNLAGTADIK